MGSHTSLYGDFLKLYGSWQANSIFTARDFHGDVVGGCTVYYTILYTLMPAVFGKIAVENSWLNQI
jgi:hypothetical protein